MSPNPATPNFNDLLLHVAEKTFGELAFLLVEPEELGSSHRTAARWGYASRVDFHGPFRGEMRIEITEDMLHPLAANMLGIDEFEDPPEGVNLEDALKELLNVTCGNLLPLVGGNEAVFHIGAPVVSTEAAPLPADLTPAGETTLNLDVGSARLSLFVEPNAAIPSFSTSPESGVRP